MLRQPIITVLGQAFLINSLTISSKISALVLPFFMHLIENSFHSSSSSLMVKPFLVIAYTLKQNFKYLCDFIYSNICDYVTMVVK